MVATPTAIALVFVMMYHPTLGVANYILSVVGLSPFRWTYSSATALYALALVDVWQWTPLIMLIALAGLASLPREPYEAAHRRRVAAPGLLAHHAAAPAARARGGDPVPRDRRVEDLRHHLRDDSGRPANASETINILLFNQAFSYFNMGYASMAVALFAVVMGASLILIKMRRSTAW